MLLNEFPGVAIVMFKIKTKQLCVLLRSLGLLAISRGRVGVRFNELSQNVSGNVIASPG